MLRRLGMPSSRALFAALLLALAAVGTAGAASAQSIVAVVNEDVVTNRDLRQRLRLALLATGQSPTEEAAARLRPQVLRALVDERLQQQEAERLGITVAEADVENALDQIAANNGVSRAQLERSLARAGVDAESLRQQIRAQIAWRQIVQRRLLPRVVVSDVQLAERLQALNEGQAELRIAEIFLPIYDPADEQRVLRDALRLRQSIEQGAEFAALARQFSAAPSAERGGDLGWLTVGSVPDELRQLVAQLPDGGVSRPVRARDGVYLFRRLGLREETGSRLAISLVRLDTEAERVDGRSVAAYAAVLREAAADCEALAAAAGGIDELTVQRLERVAPDDLRGQLATLALTAPLRVLSDPVRTVEGTTALVMICERTGGADAEQRAEVEERLRNEALERLATRYLRNLRRDAFIELRLEEG